MFFDRYQDNPTERSQWIAILKVSTEALRTFISCDKLLIFYDNNEL